MQPWIGVGSTGGWNDLDSVEVGNGSNDGLTLDERKTQLTLWAIENSNLTLGVDLTNLDSTDVGLLTNSEVLAVDQAGHPARAGRPHHAAAGLVRARTATAATPWPCSTCRARPPRSPRTGRTSASPAPRRRCTTTGRTPTWARFATGYGVSLPAHGTTLLKVVPTGAVSYTAMSYNIVNANSGLNLATSGSRRSCSRALTTPWTRSGSWSRSATAATR